MTSYAEERTEESRIVNELAEKIAQAMGWEVQVDVPPLSNQAIIKNGDKRLWFRLDWQDRTRLRISGGFPDCSQYLPYERERQEITVSIKKPIERIIKDIQNRLLPGYEEMLAYALECKIREDEQKAWQQKELEEIAGLVPGGDIRDGKIYSYESNISCRYWSDGTWDLTARLTKDKLKAILKVITETE